MKSVVKAGQEVAQVKQSIGSMWEEMHKLRKEVEVLQQHVGELDTLKDSVAALHRATPAASNNPDAPMRVLALNELRQELQVLRKDMDVETLKESIAEVHNKQAKLDDSELLLSHTTMLAEMSSVWEAVQRQRQEINSLQQVSATASAVTAVQEEVWSVWEAVKRQRQDITSLQQHSAAIHEETKGVLAVAESEAQLRAAVAEAEAQEREQFKEHIESRAVKLKEVISEEARSAIRAEIAAWKAEVPKSPVQRPDQVKFQPMTPEVRFQPMTPEDTKRPAGSVTSISPSWDRLDLQDLPLGIQASVSHHPQCEQLDLQEPEGLCCETFSTHCKRLDLEDDEISKRDFAVSAGRSDECCRGFSRDWLLDSRPSDMAERLCTEDLGGATRENLQEISTKVLDLAGASMELRVRQDLLELGFANMQDSRSTRCKEELRSEMLNLGLIPGGLCRGDTVFAEQSEQRNADFWCNLQRDYSRTPLRVLGASEDHGKVQVACAAYGTDLVVDFRRLTKSQEA